MGRPRSPAARGHGLALPYLAKACPTSSNIETAGRQDMSASVIPNLGNGIIEKRLVLGAAVGILFDSGHAPAGGAGNGRPAVVMGQQDQLRTVASSDMSTPRARLRDVTRQHKSCG